MMEKIIQENMVYDAAAQGKNYLKACAHVR